MSTGTPFAHLRLLYAELADLPDAEVDVRLASLETAEPALAHSLRRLRAQAAVPAPAPLDSLQGARFGPYRIESLLGSGGMARVYRAVRIEGEFEQDVALKLIAPGFDTPQLRVRFRRERQILARLEHPHIARLIDGGVSPDGQLWLALERVDGVPLLDWCRATQPDLDTRLRCFLDLCAAVEHAHRQLVLHRDIKPGNVLVDHAGQVKLLDFGIASLLEHTDGEARTRGGAMTIRYAAPEQVRGQRLSTATDTYALGVVLYELLTGGTPYPEAAAGLQSWAEAALDAVPARVEAQALIHGQSYGAAERRRLRGVLQAVLDRALHKQPELRYPGVQALADDLHDVRAGLAPRSGVGGTAARVALWTRRYRWPVLAVLAVLLALSAGLWMAQREARRARIQAQRAESGLQVLMDVLGAASPMDYVGREPTASDFLRNAAGRIAAHPHLDPAIRWRSLEQIGHGLLNLGQESVAAEWLEQAATAQRVDPAVGPTQQLDLLRLRFTALAAPGLHAAGRRALDELSALQHHPSLQPEILADALARAAAMCARQDQAAEAMALLAAADRRLAAVQDPNPALAESVRRQQGRVALMLGDGVTAERAFAQAANQIARAPDAFSILRRAELDDFRADASVLRKDPAAARTFMQGLNPVFQREYPAQHPERLRLQLRNMAVAMLDEDWELTRAIARNLEAQFATGGVLDAAIRRSWRQLRLQLALAERDCLAALQWVSSDPDPESSLRERQEWAAVHQQWQRQCPD